MLNRTLGWFVTLSVLVGCGSASEVPSAPAPGPGPTVENEAPHRDDAEPSLSMSAPSMIVVRPGKTSTLNIGIQRTGKIGIVRVHLEGLPQGVTANAVDLPDGATSVDLTITADVAAVVHDGTVTLRATADTREQSASPTLVVTGAPGVRDDRFGEGGAFVMDEGWGTRLLTLDDGRILLAGSKGGGGAFVRRFLRSGVVDETFGDHGVRDLPHVAGEADEFRTLEVTPQGKLILTGTREITGGKSLGIVARLSFDGSLDASFGTEGVVTVASAGEDAEFRGAVVHADGSAMVVGHVSNGQCRLLVTQLHDNGVPDDAYGVGGSAIFGTAEGVPDEDFCVASTIALPNGEIVLGATAYSETRMAIAKFTAGGAIDTSFGDAGFTLVSAENDKGAWFDSFTRAPDGMLLLAGETFGGGRWPTFARLDTSGKIDASFGVGGKRTLDLAPLGEAVPYAANATASGELIFGGYAKSSGVTQLLVGKLDGSGQVDAAFGTSGYALPGKLGRTNTLTVGIDGRVIVASYDVETNKSELVSFWH